ncbi:TLC domain-containing protein 3A [Callorhinchus milii]|uniref:TLC domain containing 3A n=2 Tax=Callorhinchus milii TaxID=7868 RepID=A0A4W3J4F2_CALMI|nr:TLC domain-containing protein 3A [Callorhinchus milii]|eukprot:gi/632965505/ref/XP_007898925.1/ PREDICTED: protein FAM57A [Callorhinchus milii]
MWLLVAQGCCFFPGLFSLTRRFLQKTYPHLTDADTAVISTRVVSAVQAVMAVVSGILITSSCNDVLRDSHWISRDYILFGSPYMAYDLFAMYLCYWYKHRGERHGNRCGHWFGLLGGFLSKNILIVLHHLLLLLVCFPITVFYRKNLGDFFLGCLLMAELSTPFLSFGKILHQFGKQRTRLYKVNAVIALVTFFVCRILLFPYMYWAFGQQFGIAVHRVPFHIPLHCSLANLMLMAPQVYWFYLLLKTVLKNKTKV